MKPKLTLIGFACIPLGALISIAFNLPWLGAPMIFAGAFLFTSFYDTAVFVDYCTLENCQYVITIRIRHYVIPLIFLGQINFIYKTSYYKVVSDTLEMDDISADNYSEISAAEYKQMLINQRQQYKNGLAPKEIVADICNPDMVCFKQRKFKYVLCLILTLLKRRKRAAKFWMLPML